MWSRFGRIGSLCALAVAAAAQTPPATVAVPGGEFIFRQMNRWRESFGPERVEIGSLGQFYVQERKVAMRPFRIGRTEVTNAGYKRFLDATGYAPKFAEGFLKHWSNGAYPAGLGDHPVTWVDMEDARAYCAWAGGALPTEEQWQMAAQGTDGRLFPWGNDPDPSKANVRSEGARPVGSYPQGASPYGALDMVGNVWEWTDSKQDDGRHWFSYLRGGAWYQAGTSVWYTEGGLMTNNQRLHFWWHSPGLNRAATIGFRCAGGER